MAKCTICNSRKGKRKCKATGTFICSQCCGTTRSAEQCGDCSFFGGAAAYRNYRRVPHFSTEVMAASPDLESISLVIESTLSLLWNRHKAEFNDRTAEKLVELLLDRYHFHEPPAGFTDGLLEEGYRKLCAEIENQLADVPEDKLIRVLAVVYRSIQRHSSGGNAYLRFINRFTGGMYMA